jgi:hypothetical protein
MPNSEGRDPKEIRRPKFEMTHAAIRSSVFGFSEFGLLLAALSRRRSGSEFGFRVSDLKS